MESRIIFRIANTDAFHWCGAFLVRHLLRFCICQTSGHTRSIHSLGRLCRKVQVFDISECGNTLCHFFYHVYIYFSKIEFALRFIDAKIRHIWFFCFLLFPQIIQAFYFSICLYNDFFGTNEVAPKRPPTVRKFRDYLLAAFAFPLALNVGVSFWSLMAIDRELILPKSFDEFFPR